MKQGMLFAAALAALVPATASAQTAPTPAPAPAAPAAAPLPEVDPARLAAAHPVIDKIWPLGTYERIMHAAIDQIMETTMSSMYNVPMDEIMAATGTGDGKTRKVTDGKTLGDMMLEADPYYRERSKATMDVMMREMTHIMNDVEPEVRAAMARAYARRFTVAQLGDLERFFATPTGAVYANESMMLMMGPDMMQAMQSFMPRLMKEMPTIMARVQEATKDLPPIPTPRHK